MTDILSESLNGIAIDNENESYVFGDQYPKNVLNRLSIEYDAENKYLHIFEKGERKKGNVERPVEIMANRARWFLKMTPFVSVFMKKKMKKDILSL